MEGIQYKELEQLHQELLQAYHTNVATHDVDPELFIFEMTVRAHVEWVLSEGMIDRFQGKLDGLLNDFLLRIHAVPSTVLGEGFSKQSGDMRNFKMKTGSVPKDLESTLVEDHDEWREMLAGIHRLSKHVRGGEEDSIDNEIPL